METRLRYSFVLSFYLLRLFASISPTDSLNDCGFCKRPSTEKNIPATFLCFYNTSIYRKSDCSIFITEDILFPHTSGNSAFRDIPLRFGTEQTISNLSVSVNGASVDFEVQENSKDGLYKVIMSTQQTYDPQCFRLSYFVQNGVMRYTDECGSGYQNPDLNVIRWSTGKWDKVIDVVRVTFVSEIKNTKFQIVNGIGNWGLVVQESFEAVSKPVEVYVKEMGLEMCELRLYCVDEAGFGLLTISVAMISFTVLVVLFLVMICCCIRAKSKAGDGGGYSVNSASHTCGHGGGGSMSVGGGCDAGGGGGGGGGG